MNFKTIKKSKILYPTNINFKPMAIGLSVGLALALSGCVSNETCTTNSCKTNVKKPIPEQNSTIEEPEDLAGGEPVPLTVTPK